MAEVGLRIWPSTQMPGRESGMFTWRPSWRRSCEKCHDVMAWWSWLEWNDPWVELESVGNLTTTKLRKSQVQRLTGQGDMIWSTGDRCVCVWEDVEKRSRMGRKKCTFYLYQFAELLLWHVNCYFTFIDFLVFCIFFWYLFLDQNVFYSNFEFQELSMDWRWLLKVWAQRQFGRILGPIRLSSTAVVDHDTVSFDRL